MQRDVENELLSALDNYMISKDRYGCSEDEESNLVDRDGNHVYFYAPVTQKSVLTLGLILRDIDKENKILQLEMGLEELPPIHLHIASFGGSYFAGLSAYEAVVNVESPVYSYIEGSCASAATFFSVAADYRFIGKQSFICIHDVRGEFEGRYLEWLDEQENMEKLMINMFSIYEKHTSLSHEQLVEIMQRDLWFTAEEALEKGLVDEIL